MGKYGHFYQRARWLRRIGLLETLGVWWYEE